ncbi:MAG TPA: DNA ligase D [Candidatus Binataceae bacterium]
MALERYRSKRSAERTPEPFGGCGAPGASSSAGPFVVQKHAARRLHYDFRLEMEGVPRSWAIPKGPSLNPADKHLAVMVEDHPIDYADFEGNIPEGNYGAGAVIVWDRGWYHVIDPPGADAAESVRKGKLDIELHGFKLHGAFTLVRTRRLPGQKTDGKENWLLIKKRDEYVIEGDVGALHPRSVLSGLTIEEIRESAALSPPIVKELTREGAPVLEGALDRKRFPLSLAKTAERPFDSDKWLFEIKYDGVRALAIRDGRKVQLYARSGSDITEAYPEIVLALNAMPFERFAIDGEIVAPGDDGRPSFQRLQPRMHVRNAALARRLSVSIPVRYFAFDLLAFDAFDLRPLATEVRKRILARVAKGEGPVQYCEHTFTHGNTFYEAVGESGLEGMVAKRRDAPYRGTRTGDWLKVKCPLTRRFVIGGYTDPEGACSHFGALLLGLWEAGGALRFVGRAGTGFSDEKLTRIHRLLEDRARADSPFRPAGAGESPLPHKVHFVEPNLVCEVRFAEVTDDGCIRHPAFLRMLADADPRECRIELPFAAAPDAAAAQKVTILDDAAAEPAVVVARNRATVESRDHDGHDQSRGTLVKVTNADKVFWPKQRFTKGDLIEYYRAIAPWMLPYLKDRPVMITRYPEGIEGNNFYQKDAPSWAPKWIRTEKIYSEDSQREIGYFVLDSAEALAYIANMGTIPIHIWSSRIPHLERPDWLLFDIDPKGSTTAKAAEVARETMVLLRKLSLRPVVKTSGQAGFHVVVGLKAIYTYEQAKNFSELASRLVVGRMPELATIDRNVNARKGRVYIDYLQLGHGKTIAATFSARPIAGASVSAPIELRDLRSDIDVTEFNIKTMPRRMARLGRDPFLGAINDPQRLEDALPRLERDLKDARLLG